MKKIESQEFICADCGDLFGTPKQAATWHEGECAMCGEKTSVSQRRHFIKRP